MSMVSRVLRALLLVTLTATAGTAQDLPSFDCVRTATPPVIDGDPGDSAWRRAVELALIDVADLSGQRQHSRPTMARMLWDEDHLYFLFTMVDADVWSTFTNRDDQIWQEEVVEIFIDPDGDGLDYAEIEINPLNTIFDLLLSKPWADSGRGFAEWNPVFSSAVSVQGTVDDAGDTDTAWTVELALPWEALATDIRDVMNEMSLPPQVGDRWRINLYRFERIRTDGSITAVEASSWSPVGEQDFHRPDRFGWMTFVDAATAVDDSSWSEVKRTVN